MAADERDIVLRAQRGDRLAFEELIRRSEQMVFAMLLRQLGDRERARDLTQEVFLRAFRSLHTFRAEAKFSTWVTQIALNCAANFVRSRAFLEMQRTVADRKAQLAAQSNEAPAEELEHQRRLDLFRLKLAELPEHYRSVLIMCGLEGKSYQEAADTLGSPIGTVRSRLNKARLLMQRMVHD